MALQRRSSTFTSGFGSDTSKANGWYGAAVAGGQHFFSPHFSLGAEGQLSRSSMTIDEDGQPDPKTGSVSTVGLVTVRWYY